MMLQDVKNLIRSIESVLLRPVDVRESELMNLADQHEQFVKAASDRLEHIDSLLQKGLRTEAIELADQEPNLNDLLTALDFPELVPWNDLLQQRGMQPVQGIPVEAAAELNDAYLAVGSIEKLLQNYRGISLARAPLSKRIAALRLLALRDPRNPVWSADLKEFERHRLKLLREDLDAAVAAEDVARLASLDAELSASGWTVEVPAKIREQVHAAHQNLRRRQAREELQTLSHQLSDAYSAFDLPAASAMEKRLRALQAILGIDDQHQLMQVAAPALDWLREERIREAAEADHMAAVRELETQLDGRTNLPQLEKLYHQATRFGHTLSPALLARLTERRDQLVRESRLRRAFTAALIVLVLVLATGLVGWMIQISSFNRAVTRHAEQLEKLLASAESSGEIASVESYFANLESNEPNVLQTPQLMARKSEFDALLSSERGRSSRIQQLMASIQQVLDSQPDLQTLQSAERTAEEFRSIVRSEAEKAEHARLVRTISSTRREVQSALDADFSHELEILSTAVQRLAADNLAEYDAAITRLTALNNRPDVSANLKTLSATLLQKVQGDRILAAESLNMAADLQRITESVGNIQAYEQAVSQFVRNNPGKERSTQLQKLLQEELSVWQAATQWKSLRSSLQAADLRRIGSSEAGQLLVRAEDYAQKSGPLGAELLQTQRVQALRRIQARNPDGNRSFRDRVLAIFAGRLTGRTYMVQTLGRGRYYCARPPKINGKSTVTVEYFLTTSGSQTKIEDLRYTDVPDAAQKTQDEEWLSPQSRLLLSVEDKLPDWSQLNFEAAAASLTSEILAANEVDNVLRLFLLEDVLRLCSEGSEFLRVRCEPLAMELSGAGVSRLSNWAAPQDSRADDSRFAAKRTIERISEKLNEAFAAAAMDLQTESARPLLVELQWVGWLHRNAAAEWVVSFRPGFVGAASGGRLLIFPRTPAGTVRSLVLTTVDPTARLSQTVSVPPEAGQEGRPVFLEISDRND